MIALSPAVSDGQWQMFHAEIAENPAAQHDKRLQHDVLMHLPATTRREEYRVVEHRRRITQNDARQENQTREKGVQEQHGNNRIPLQRLFLQRIIAAQQRCRHKS